MDTGYIVDELVIKLGLWFIFMGVVTGLTAGTDNGLSSFMATVVAFISFFSYARHERLGPRPAAIAMLANIAVSTVVLFTIARELLLTKDLVLANLCTSSDNIRNALLMITLLSLAGGVLMYFGFKCLRLQGVFQRGLGIALIANGIMILLIALVPLFSLLGCLGA